MPWVMRKGITYASAFLLFVDCSLMYMFVAHGYSNCDLTIISQENSLKNGTFQSPNWPDNYGNNMICTYKFVGLPDERVRVKFTRFKVDGMPPDCLRDYVDVWIQLKSPDEDILDSPLFGRYCNEDKPRQLISLNRTLVFGLYTDEDKTEKGFAGTYEFIDGTKYTVGEPAPAPVCGFTIRSEALSKGVVLSPNFPGVYPSNLFCFYKFEGRPGERVRLEFRVLNLFFGGAHCPYDYVKVYDGGINDAPVIGVYCGEKKDLVVYSTGKDMHVEFVTKPTPPPTLPKDPLARPIYYHSEMDNDSLKRGFKAAFEFSSQFVKVNFIESNAAHLRGTECDQRVLSSGVSNATIRSPGFPNRYPPNVTCRYYLDGMKDAQNLEIAKLWFESLDIPSSDAFCSNGFVALYLHGQTENDRPDRIYCGNHPPGLILSQTPRLLLVFNSQNALAGRGFEARLQFITDYGIPGTTAPDSVCEFFFESASRKSGTFNSPRHPANYPHNTTCLYHFNGKEHENVKIWFDTFNMMSASPTDCTQDWIEIYTVYPEKEDRPKELLQKRYCGEMGPAPYVTERGAAAIKIIFRSDGEGVSAGFRARYEFLPEQRLEKTCGETFEGEAGGVFMSPNFPLKYVINSLCDWDIIVREGYQVLLTFPAFSLEGNLHTLGCKGAILRIYVTDDPTVPAINMCGPFAELPSEYRQILSRSNHIFLRFTSSVKSIGSKGFKIAWTEVKLPNVTATEVSSGPTEVPAYEAPECEEFQCVKTRFCISQSLQCNKLPNCGADDDSDEASACPEVNKLDLRPIIISCSSVAGLFILMIIFIILFRRKRRKHHQKKNSSTTDGLFVRYSLTQSTDTLR